MKQVVRVTILFVLLTAFFYLINQAVINKVYWSGKRLACTLNPQFASVGGQDRQVIVDWKNDAMYDVVIAGSSHAYRGYDPRIFRSYGYNMYTIGTGYQNTLASFLLLKNDCRPIKNSLVVLDVYDNTFSSDGMGCFSRLIANARCEASARDFLMHKFDLRLLNSYFCYVFTDLEREESPLKDGYISNGYSENQDTTKMALDSASAGVMEHEFNPTYITYIERIHKLLNELDCQLVLASHPMMLTPRNRAFHEAFRSYIDPVIQSEKLIYIDLSERVDFNPNRDFMDSNHLNQHGVEKYNKILIDTLHKLQFLPVRSKSFM